MRAREGSAAGGRGAARGAARRGAASEEARTEGNAREGCAGTGVGVGMRGEGARAPCGAAWRAVAWRHGAPPAGEEEWRGEGAAAGGLRGGGNLHRSMGIGVGNTQARAAGVTWCAAAGGARRAARADRDAPAAARTRGTSSAGMQQREPQEARMGAVAPRGKGLESACMRAAPQGS